MFLHSFFPIERMNGQMPLHILTGWTSLHNHERDTADLPFFPAILLLFLAN